MGQKVRVQVCTQSGKTFGSRSIGCSRLKVVVWSTCSHPPVRDAYHHTCTPTDTHLNKLEGSVDNSFR